MNGRRVSKRWDEEAHLLVVGYGLAGEVAVIGAHGSGVEVTILEKSQYPEGCSILPAGTVLSARNVEEAAKEPLA